MLMITMRVMMAAGCGGDEGEVNGASIGGGCDTLAACNVYFVMSFFYKGLKTGILCATTWPEAQLVAPRGGIYCKGALG